MSKGFLAIWSDIDPASETDYLHWFSREHAIERVSIPGFLAVRMFRALDEKVRRYFILYELESADVVGSDAYLARLNQPTPWSQRIMPQLGNFARGGGHSAVVAGAGYGGFVAVLRLDSAAAGEAAKFAESIARRDLISAVRVLMTDQARTGLRTSEKSLRADDRSFEALLVIEGLDVPSLQAAVEAVLVQFPRTQIVGAEHRTIFSTVFSLDRRLIGASSAAQGHL